MDLDDHGRRQSLGRQSPVDADHGHLDEVRRRALDGGVDGHPLGKLTDVGVDGVEVGQVAAAVHEGADVAVPAGLFQHPVQVAFHPGVSPEVFVYVGLGELLVEVEFLGQTEGAHPVENAEVDHLGLAAHLLVHEFREDAEDGGCGSAVDVLAVPEGGDQGCILREVGQDPQLDLGIVGGDEPPPRRGDEGLADSLSFHGADGDVLQVGIAAGEPARGRYRLVEGGVESSGPGMHQGRQGIDIS